jgi:hypothetical protein
MLDNLSPDKSHEENVKVVIDKILGQPTILKRKKKSAEDHKRILFCRIIDGLIVAEEKAIAIDEMFSINMEKYNITFFDVIQDLLNFSFNKEQLNLINFFMYDRYSADGAILDLVDTEGKLVPLESSTDLWFLIKKFE